MLTTTYSMVVLSSEQQNTRRILGKLEQYLHNGSWLCADGVDRVWLERVLHTLMKVHRYCHERKVELYVIPALRRSTADAANLLERIDELCSDAKRILLHVCSQFESAESGRFADIRALVTTIELYCRQLAARLSLEEDELFPVARRHLSTEAWFHIAASCLPRQRHVH
ncbi:hypothetical protein [Noviherbaspirillum denitrificans]|uniref:Hemerythrin-like domain-containing protein n=1 Tax=Noviherbaspirillum denitrificans TaxID=1968433 RepID=A0A254T7L0_9BURK|nr:hypothetical protein [Noviherbaspirillum denitrificans]OWW18630.1 hypothetical protein AYR66_03310 [Noviherbaspirillum denitrificans]